MRFVIAVFLVAFVGVAWFVISTANRAQDHYDECWAHGGVQVKTSKFSDGSVCIDRDAVITLETTP